MPALTVNGLAPPSNRKRTRFQSEDQDGDEVVESLEAQSALRQDHRKRVRVSGTSSRRDGPSRLPDDAVKVFESDGEDAEMDDADDSRIQLGATQYENLRDNNFKHLQHEREDDLWATQRIKDRPNIVGNNHTAENGILESVTCINFMCHERLHCELGPLLNFIVGENGSGKSAILTAITICLGGKASSTNRAGSLKALIKAGKDQGIITVKIKNQGLDAFQHETYGDSIIVERHFSVKGTSSFKVKSATGRIIDTKRGKVEEIVEYYCLQVDNPLNVLSQDNARSFLNSASDSEKYEFFIKGVQLEQLDNDYRLVNEYLEAANSRLPDQDAWVKQLRGKLEEAKKLAKSIQRSQELRRKRTLYSQQLIWCQVVDQENLLEARKTDAQEFDRKIREQEENAERASSALDEADVRVTHAEENLMRVKEDEPALEAKAAEAKENFEASRKELEKLRAGERDAHGRLNQAKNEKILNQASIDEEKRRVAGSTGGEVTRKRDEKDAENKRLEKIQNDIRENGEHTPDIERRLGDTKKEQARLHHSAEDKLRDLRTVERKIKDMEREDRSPLDCYEPRVPDLLREIQRDSGYREKPVGPMGSLIRLQKPQWSSILERTMGRILNSFIVTSKADEQRLKNNMRRLNIRNCPIVIGNRTPIDTRGKEPDAEFDTILRVLKFEDDIVRSQLIIMSSIEQIILIPKRTDAEKVMFNGPVPKNVRACLAFHDTKRGHGLRLFSKPGGQSITTSAVAPSLEKPRMKADAQSQIRQEREVLSQLQEEHVSLCRQRDEVKAKAREIDQALQTKLREKQILIKAERLCQASIRRLDEELDAFEGYDDRLRVLEESRARLVEEYDTYGRQYGDLSVLITEQNQKAEALRAEWQREKNEISDFTQRLDKAQRKVTGCRDARRIKLQAKNAAYEEMQQLKNDKTRADRKVREQEATLAEFMEQARRAQPERVFVPEGETYASISRKMELVTEQIDSWQQRIGMTEEQVVREASEAKRAYDEATEAYTGNKALVKQMKQSMELRLEKWRTFQRYISAHARINFLYLLSERGFRGKLEIDHVNKKLGLRIEPDAAKKSGQGRNTKTLSGGEKSFSSICLLLSIWDSMGSPLRCLDEFDVFMDNVNRAISTNMLVDAARKSVSRQYIMITPNAIEGRAKVDKDVKIIRMKDPRQRTIDEYAE